MKACPNIYTNPQIKIVQLEYKFNLLQGSPTIGLDPSVEPWEDGGEEELLF